MLQVTDLRTYFDTPAGELKAVDGVSLTVREAQVLAIVGESGSGKSVTGLSLMRLLGRTTGRVAGGKALFLDKTGSSHDLLSITEPTMRRLRGSQIAMIFQNPMASLNPVFTIGEQIGETIRVHQHASRALARRAAIDLLAQVGIADPQRRVDAYPHELSGGMRQRAMIALALACDPKLLIADEPTTALDVTIQAQIIHLLKRLRAQRAMAMIFVTHDLNLVGEIADRVAVMYAGEVVEEGDAHDVIHGARHPYTRALLACIPRRSYETADGRTLRPIPGGLPDPLSRPPGCRFHPRCLHARDICRHESPRLESTAPGHRSACLRWRELA